MDASPLLPYAGIQFQIIGQRFRLAVHPAVGPAGGDIPGQVHAHHAGNGIGTPFQGFGIQIRGGEDGAHGTAVADVAGQGPGVQSFDAQYVLAGKVVGKGLGRSESCWEKAGIP
jgi:hypothetical protein